jgi:hypothetical protein
VQLALNFPHPNNVPQLRNPEETASGEGNNGWISGWGGQDLQELLLKQALLNADKPKMAQVYAY